MTASETTTDRRRAQTRRERAIVYVRVSDVGNRGGESFISPEVQEETGRRRAGELGLEVAEVIVDIDESGAKWDRPGFQRMLRAAAAGEASVVIVSRLTRFARSVLDTHRALEQLEAAGARLIACDMDIDTTTATGRLIRGVLTELAQFELERTSETWLEAKAAAVGRGAYIANRAPIGYRFGAGHALELDPVVAPIVVELFELRAGGASWGTLLEHFEQRSGRKSARQTMAYLTSNRAYLGELVHGSGAEQLVNREAHEAIVELELWDRVQLVNRERAGERGGRGHAGRSHSLLGGIARCSSCGRGLVRKSKRPESGRRNSYDCPSPARHCAERAHIGEAELDSWLEEELLAWAGAAAEEPIELELEPAGDRLEAEERLAASERLLASYVASLEVQELDQELFEAGLASRRQLVELRRQELEAIGEASELEVIRTTLREVWPELELAERRRLIRTVLAGVIVRRTPRIGAPASERAELAFLPSSGEAPLGEELPHLLEEAAA